MVQLGEINAIVTVLLAVLNRTDGSGYFDFKALKLPPLPSIVKRPFMRVPVSFTVPVYVTAFIVQLTFCPFNSPVS